MVAHSRLHAALYAGDVSPTEAWQALESTANAQLVDVRTHAEWVFSGIPSLEGIGKSAKTVSLKLYPNFELNPQFLSQLEAAVPDKSAPVYFLCKTGGRSADAAVAATAAGYTTCYNIAHGFEGDSNPTHQRGKVNGWKADALPWHQA
jgi:rhodanese-related sulfurtransferase